MDTSAVRTAINPTSSPNPDSTPSSTPAPTVAPAAQVKLPEAAIPVPSDVVGHYLGARRDVPLIDGREAAITDRLQHIDALAELAKTRPAALKALGQIFRTERGVAHEVRSAAGDKLRDLGAVEELVKALDSNRENLARIAARLLGEIGPDAAAALPRLEDLTMLAHFKEIKEAWSGTIGEAVRKSDHGRAAYQSAIERINGTSAQP